MELKHLCLKDTGSTLAGLAVTLSKLLFSLCPNSPITWTQKAPSLYLSGKLMARWQSQGVSEALHHLSSLNEGAKLLNCFFCVSAFLSTESTKKIGA